MSYIRTKCRRENRVSQTFHASANLWADAGATPVYGGCRY